VSEKNVTRPQAVRGLAFLVLLAVLGAAACSSSTSTASQAGSSQTAQTTVTPGPTFDAGGFKLTSTAYAEGDTIPVKYTCMGDSVSPPLAWVGAPAETAAYALIMEDYSAQVTHWVIYNMPGAPSGTLPEGYSRSKSAPPQAVHYLGPCPPAGTRNKYNISLYALSAPLSLTNATTQGEVEDAMAGKILARTSLAGWYAME
jgi:Raf kinase inhibitor-like YbhB/YbcL family protein